jgi:predicted glycoside hydrolase/deacetylase ChbG (UPF0249 family)
MRLLPQRNPEIIRRLGYPPDAKLLVIHADDLAVSHAENMASFKALDEGWVSSASIMVPGPWLTEVADYAKSHPTVDLGIHVTLTSEWNHYRWGPVASHHKVKSLLDAHGYFYRDIEKVVRRSKPNEVELELRAQIEAALKMGIRPTHLDSHMCVLNFFASPGLMEAYVNVAHEYHLPYLMSKVPGWSQRMYAAVHSTDLAMDSVFSASENLDPDGWLNYYINILKTVPRGISQIVVHPAYKGPEMKAITKGHQNYGNDWRQRDFDAISSPKFRRALVENNITVVNWRQLGSALRPRSGGLI